MRNAAFATLMVLVPALTAQAQTPLEAALSASSDGALYAFDMAFEDSGFDWQFTVDPSQPEGERLTLIAPSEDSLDDGAAKRLAELQKHTRGAIFCSEFAEQIPADAELVGETDTTAIYTFTPIPGEDDGDMAKAFKHLTGYVTVSKETPGILQFQMFADKPFKPMAIAKVRTFNMQVACEPLEDGRTRMLEMAFTLEGSAMMQKFNQSERRTISNLVELPGASMGSNTVSATD